jgi:NADPH:quinone reductase
MVEVRRSTIVDAPIEQVWSIIRDFNGHDTWHPVVARSRIEDGLPPDMIGVVRDFQLADGSCIREQLLSLSDSEHSFEYCILNAPLPLMGYVARVKLLPVTDGQQTYWEWRSTFKTPPARESALAKLVGDDIYEAGFRAIKHLLKGRGKAKAPQVAKYCNHKRHLQQVTRRKPSSCNPTAGLRFCNCKQCKFPSRSTMKSASSKLSSA